MNASLKDARILIIDDQQANVEVLENLLMVKGYLHVKSVTDARKAIPAIKEIQPELILLDLMMPHLSGFEVMAKMKEEGLMSRFMPIMVLTADVSMEAKQRALAGGASDFTTKPFNLVEVDLRIKNLLFNVYLLSQLKDQNQVLEDKVAERTRDLEQAKTAAEESEERYRSLFNANQDCITLFSIDNNEPSKLISCNDAAPRLLGYTRAEMLTLTIFDIDVSCTPDVIGGHIDQLKATGQLNFETQYRCKDGSLKEMDVKASFVHLQGQNIVMKIARDISALKAQQKAIQLQNEKLKEIAWAQSHLVRAPLTKIMGAIDLLSSNPDQDKEGRQVLIQALEQSSAELDNIIQDITEKSYAEGIRISKKAD
ncbi:MAG: response regulator [Chitinophagales bacterium]|nr:response regulator [Chitinophagales bacterium]